MNPEATAQFIEALDLRAALTSNSGNGGSEWEKVNREQRRRSCCLNLTESQLSQPAMKAITTTSDSKQDAQNASDLFAVY
ncbi:MAG: hypothetical protein LRZ88_13565 [Candidatus Cloacimonetes bacterium]|nr:hypothetical protein [Candidatus Cloacimonadota bacterium]